MCSHRELTPQEITDYLPTILSQLQASFPGADKEWIEDNLLTRGTYVKTRLIEDKYILLYTVSGTWYCPEPNLVELGLYTRPGVGGNSNAASMREVGQAMEELAEEHGCRKILVGTSAARSNAALARLYSRYGFQVDAWSLSKTIE